MEKKTAVLLALPSGSAICSRCANIQSPAAEKCWRCESVFEGLVHGVVNSAPDFMAPHVSVRRDVIDAARVSIANAIAALSQARSALDA